MVEIFKVVGRNGARSNGVGGKTEVGKGGKNGTLRFPKPSASVLLSLTGLPVAKKGLTLTNQI